MEREKKDSCGKLFINRIIMSFKYNCNFEIRNTNYLANKGEGATEAELIQVSELLHLHYIFPFLVIFVVGEDKDVCANMFLFGREHNFCCEYSLPFHVVTGKD